MSIVSFFVSGTNSSKTAPHTGTSTYRRKRNNYHANGSTSSYDINTQINTINTIRNTYSTSYTVHGMAKIFHGLLWERALWFIVLLSCLGTVLYFTHGFYVEYTNYEIRTEFRLKSLKTVTLPTITLCENSPLEIHALCYKDISLWEGGRCTQYNNFSDQIGPLSRSKGFTQHMTFPQCMIFNKFGNLSASRFILFMGTLPDTYIFIHNHDDVIAFRFVNDNRWILEFENLRGHEILFNDKQIISRLPEPFPSHCSSGQYDDNILPGPYTKNKCQHTCLLRLWISKCSALPNEWLRYVPNLKALLPAHNKSDDYVIKCLKEEYDSYHWGEHHCDCRVSCKETSIKHQHIKNNPMIKNIAIKYTSNTITEITEIPAYPATKFITDIGGWVGLFSGMSLLSVIEIILTVNLTLLAAYYKLKRFIIERKNHQRQTCPA